MDLMSKIIALYPDLTPEDFVGFKSTIALQDDMDGKGPYIKEWNNTKYPKPTDEQLA
jgi:hypothetical protein